MTEERGLVRSFHRLHAVWITLALAVMVVGIAVLVRSQPAEPMDYSNSLPMRNLMPQEAAALLETGDRLARIGDDSVDLITTRRLVPLTSPKGATILIRRGSRLWAPKNAGSRASDLALRYRLDRASLERALGGRSLATFFDPKAGSRELSFSSERMPLYAAFEVAILWALFLLFWLIVRYLRPCTLILPALLVLGIALLFALMDYGPPLDVGFYQRWAVDRIYLPLFVFLFPLTVLSGLSLLGLIGTGVLWLARRGKGTLRPAHRIVAVCIPIALVVLGLYAIDRTSAARERRALDAASRAIHFEDSTAVLAESRALLGQSGRRCFGVYQSCQKIGDLPPHLRRFVTDTLAGVPEMPDGEVCILVPVSGDDYLFLFLAGTPRSAYMDLRDASPYGVDTMLRTKLPYRTYFVPEMLDLLMGRGARRFNGRPVLRADGRVGAIVYTDNHAF